MFKEEIECIERYLNKEDIMVEWGSGGSTQYFPKFVKEYYSIEHDKKWFDIIKKDLPQNVKYYLIYQNFTRSIPTKREEFKDYVEAIRHLGIRLFNKVLIDGRARLYCALESIYFLNKDSRVFIHDFYLRPYYHWALRYYDTVEEIMAGNGIVVLKLKEQLCPL